MKSDKIIKLKVLSSFISGCRRLYVIFIRNPRWRFIGMSKVFQEHYNNNNWGSEESRSGFGSTFDLTEVIRSELPTIVKDLNIKTILDIPCGDFNWMKFVDIDVTYIGADIVNDVINKNNKLYYTQKRRFINLDLTESDLDKVDLILCRDCLFHFSFQHIHKALMNIKRSDSMFLLTTTNIDVQSNKDIVTGEWRKLNLQAPPFCLPKPAMLIDERRYDGAHLGLWRVKDIP